MQKSLLKLLVICLLGSVDYSCCIAGLGQQKSGRLRHKAVTTVGPFWRREMSSAFAAECVWGKPHGHTLLPSELSFFLFKYCCFSSLPDTLKQVNSDFFMLLQSPHSFCVFLLLQTKTFEDTFTTEEFL